MKTKKSRKSGRTIGLKALSLFLSLALVIGMVPAVAMGGNEESQNLEPLETTQENVVVDKTITFIFDNASATVDVGLGLGAQAVLSSPYSVPGDADITVRPVATLDNYSISSVEVTNANGALTVDLAADWSFTLPQAQVDNTLVITIKATENTPAPEPEPEPTSEPATPTPDNPQNQNVDALNANIVEPLDDGATLTPIDGSVDWLYLPSGSNPEPVNGVISVDSGLSIVIKAFIALTASSEDVCVYAIPIANDGAQVTMKPVSDITLGVVDSSMLPGLDQSYSKYAIAIIKGSNSGINQMLDVSVFYPNGTTQPNAEQPLVGHLLMATSEKPEGSTNEGLLGLGYWIDTTYTIAQTSTEYTFKPLVETHTIDKTLVSISEENGSYKSTTDVINGLDPNLEADPALINYNETGGTYTATYVVSIKSDKSGTLTGRLGVKSGALLTDTLTGMLEGKNPKSIKITALEGALANTTVTGTDVASVNLALTSITGFDVLNDQSYKIEVTYDRDDYTDFVGQAKTLIDGKRQVITNTANAAFTYVSDTATTTINDTSQNAIGYVQGDPNAINYTVEKMIGYSQKQIVYNAAAQEKYPSVQLPTFVLTKVDASGTKVGQGETLILGTNGRVVFNDLEANATYILEETVGVDRFTKISDKYVEVRTTSTATTITTKDSFEATSGVTGSIYQALNSTENTGDVTINVVSQTVTGNTINTTFANQAGKTVQLKDGATVVATGVTDKDGEVYFDYLDTSKTYSIVVGGIDENTYELATDGVEGEDWHALNVSGADFGDTVKLKYISKLGSLTVGKTFEGVFSNASNLTATFVLKANTKYVQANGTLTDNIDNAFKIVCKNGTAGEVKFPVLLAPGAYTLEEIDIKSSVATDDMSQFTKVTQSVTVEKGANAKATVANVSTKGRLTVSKTFTGPESSYNDFSAVFKIKDASGSFVKNAEGTEALSITVGHGKSESFPLLPAGEYTLVEDSVTAPEGKDTRQFVPVANKEITITAGKTITEAVKNESTKGGLSIKKTFVGVESYTGFSADFKIKKTDGSYVKNAAGTEDLVVTVAHGATVTLPVLLESGIYTIEEVAVKDSQGEDASGQFAKQTITNVEIVKGVAKTQTVTNTSNRGQLTIQNFDYKEATSANLTAGEYVYTIKGENGFTQEVTIAQNAASTTVVVPAGTYTVVLKSAPGNATKVSEVGTTVTVVAAKKSSGSAKVTTVNNKLTLDLNNAVQTAAFLYGFPTKITGTKTNAITNAVIKDSGAAFDLQKLEGATYVSTGTTVSVDTAGAFAIEGLTPGKYQLEETVVPIGYATPKTNFEFEITDYAPLNTTKAIGAIKNAPFAHLQIKLVSTEDASQLAGAEFDLLLDTTVVGSATVADDGYVKFFKDGVEVDLEPGATYTVAQRTGVAGYEKRSDVATVKVKDTGAFDSISFVTDPRYAHQGSSTSAGTIIFSNVPFGEVTAVKYGQINVFKGQDYQTALLPGAVFIIKDGVNILRVNKVGDIYVIDHSAFAADQDDLSAQIVSGATGAITIKGLDPAKTYSLVELSAPAVIKDAQGHERLTYDLSKSTQITIGGTNQDYVYEKNTAGAIVRYKPTSLGDIQNYIEDTAQIELNKVLVKCSVASHYPENDNSVNPPINKKGGHYHDASLDPNTPCVLVETPGSAPNGEFEIWRNFGTVDNPDWVFIETIVTGTAYPGDLNRALSSSLPAGSYKLIETKAPMYAKSGDNNNLYTIDENGAATGLVKEDGKLVYTFTLDPSTANTEGKVEIKLGNDDGRGNGDGTVKYVQLYGQKLGFKGYDNESALLSNVVFEVELGYYDADGTFVLLQQLSNVTSGTVDIKDANGNVTGKDRGGFITQVVNLGAYTYKYDSGTQVQGQQVQNFVYKLTEKGPLPHSYDQSAIGTVHYVTIPAFDALGAGPLVLKYDQEGVEGAQIANYEAGATIKITKVDGSNNPVDGSEFTLYNAKGGSSGLVGAPTIYGNAANATNVIAGTYYIEETVSPTDFNRNGSYEAKITYLDRTFKEWKGVFSERTDGRIAGPDGSGLVLPWGSKLEIKIKDNVYASFTIDNYWDGSQDVEPAVNTASYTVSYEGGYAAPAGIGSIVVTDKVTLTNLPDGAYTIQETALTDASVYNMNAAAKGNKIVVVIEDGKIKSVTSGGTNVNTSFSNGVKEVSYTASTASVNINHLTKTKLIINKGYIDSAGTPQNTPLNDLTQAVFKVEGSDKSTRTYTWPTDSFMYLEEGVTYTVVEESVTTADQYTIDTDAVYVKGGDTGTVYLLNNKVDGKAYGTASSELNPLTKTSTVGYFYNERNVGQLTITKTEVDNPQKIITAGSASFVLYTKSGDTKNYFMNEELTQTTTDIAEAYEFTTTNGKVVINNIPTPSGSDTTYFIKETAAPAGYYNVDTEYEVSIKANTANAAFVKNPALQTLTVKKLTDKLVNGVKDGTITTVQGQKVDLYRVNSDGTKTFVANGTTKADGTCTFTGLAPNANGTPAYYMIVETVAAGGTILNQKYADASAVTKMIEVSYDSVSKKIVVSAVEAGIDTNLPEGYEAFSNNTLTIKNPALESLTVKKLTDATDANGKKTGAITHLNGQTVTLYKLEVTEEQTDIASAGSGLTKGSGTINFSGLSPNADGTPAFYMIVESDALAGYLLNPAYTSLDPKQMIKVSYDADNAQGASIKVEAVADALATDLPQGVEAFVSNGKSNVVTIKNPVVESLTVKKITNKVVLNTNNETVQEVVTVPGQDLSLYRLTNDGTGKSAVVPADGAALSTGSDGTISFSGLTPVDETTPAYYMVVETASVPYLNLNDVYADSDTAVKQHIKVSYANDADAGLVVKVEATDAIDTQMPEGYTAFSGRTLTIANPYNNNIIVAFKADMLTGAPLAGAQFKLVNSKKEALIDAITDLEVTATTDTTGYAYFQYTAAADADPNDIYILETEAPDNYLLSTYENEIFKKVEKVEGSNNIYKIVKFMDRKVQDDLSVRVAKDGALADDSGALALGAVDASFTITPTNTKNTVPLNNYTVTDTGIKFNNGTVASADLTYTVKTVTVNAPTSDSGLTPFVSFDGGTTWNAFTEGVYTHTLNAERDASMTTELFSVLYGEGTSADDATCVLGTNFVPGTIEVAITFNQFKQAYNDEGIYFAEITKITNTVSSQASYQVAPSENNPNGWRLTEKATATKTLTLDTVKLPTMSIDKAPDEGQIVGRGGTVNFTIQVKNTSSDTSVVNPVVIESMINSGGLYADVDTTGALTLEKVLFANVDCTDQFAGTVLDNNRVVVWDFTGMSLGPNETITITYKAQVDSVTPEMLVNNTAYATSKIVEEGINKNETVYSASNPSGARFIPVEGSQVVKAGGAEYNELFGITEIDGRAYIKAIATQPLTTTNKLSAQRSVLDPTTLTWVSSSSPVDHTLGDDKIRYMLQMQNDYQDVEASFIEFYEIVPYYGYLGTDMPQEFLEKMTIANLSVSFNTDDITTIEGTKIEYLHATGVTGSGVYDAIYNDDPTGAVGFKVSFPVSEKRILKNSDIVKVTYDLTFPDLDITKEQDFELADKAINTVADAEFFARYSLVEVQSGEVKPISSNYTGLKIKSNNVVARLVAEPVTVSGIVWDDTLAAVTPGANWMEAGADRVNGDGVYAQGDKGIGGVEVVLLASQDKGQNWTQIAVDTTDDQGAYSFSNLTSSLGNGPLYKLEFRHVDNDHAWQISPYTKYVDFDADGNYPIDKSHIIKPASNSWTNVGGAEVIISDTGAIKLQTTGTALVNAGFNKIPFRVNYEYVGFVPGDATPLPAEAWHTFGQVVDVAQLPTAAGYDFIGWTEDGPTFTMESKDKTIQGSWVARGDTPYRIEYYLQNVTGSGYSIDTAATVEGKGETDTTITAPIRSYVGFTHNPNAAGTLLMSHIAGDGSTVLKVYYDRNAYTVTYVYTGVTPVGAPAVPGSAQYLFGQTVTVAGNPTLAGYTFSGWDRAGSFQMPANDVTIAGSWTFVPPFIPTIVPDPDPDPDPEPEPDPDTPESNITNPDTPLTNIPDDQTPRDGGASWALVNLILTIIGTLLAVVMLISYFIKRRREDENEEEAEQRRVRLAAAQATGNTDYDEEQPEDKKKRLAGRVMAAVGAVVAIILFILTEDITLPIALVDWWTIGHVIIAIVQIVGWIWASRKKDLTEEDTDEEMEAARQTLGV